MHKSFVSSHYGAGEIVGLSIFGFVTFMQFNSLFSRKCNLCTSHLYPLLLWE